MKVSATIPLFSKYSSACTKVGHNREGSLIREGGVEQFGMLDFPTFNFLLLLLLLLFFLGGVVGGGAKSNYYTNRLKLPLSTPRIVDGYPSNGTKYS